MFSKFKILAIYLIIQSICDNVTPFTDEKTTLSIEEQVQKELSPIREKLKNIKDPLINKDENIWLKGEIQGEVKKIIERAVNAEQENKMLIEDKGSLKEKMENADMFQLLLALTSRVDTLEQMLAPTEKFKSVQRSERWMKILSRRTPAVEELRKKIKSAGMTEISFAKTVERLVNERNDRAGHANIPLPSLVREKTVEGALRIMDITEDHEAVETLKILVEPVKYGDLTSVKT